MVAANARTAIAFALSPGNARDAPGGYRLLRDPGKAPWPVHLLMDRAQEGDEARQLAPEPGFVPGGVPPEANRLCPLGMPPRHGQAAQRDRTAVPSAQGLATHLLQVRETGCDVHRIHQLRTHRRRVANSVNRP